MEGGGGWRGPGALPAPGCAVMAQCHGRSTGRFQRALSSEYLNAASLNVIWPLWISSLIFSASDCFCTRICLHSWCEKDLHRGEG